MARSSSLKGYANRLVYAVLAAHLFGFLWIIGVADSFNLKKLAVPGASAASLLAVVGLVLRGLVSASWRDRVAHMRWNNPLPGSRAFTVIGPRDTRVNMAQLKRNQGKLPSDQAEQNRKFYEIYRKHHSDTGIVDAHKSYLAARDISVVNFLLTVPLASTALYFSQNYSNSLFYLIALFLSYFASSVAAETYGNRMVANTLACASSRRGKGKKRA